jgi:Ca2+-transporting ATPase
MVASAGGVVKGLNRSEAAGRFKLHGPNELPRPDRRTPFRIVLEVLREPMLALLLAAGLIYLMIGSLEEALILLAFASLSVLITVIQEARTERVLEALRDLTSPRALVIRDGVRQRIAGREVVLGDILLLGEGDRVAADAHLIEASDMLADESLLTGESVAVRKLAMAAPAVARPGGDDLPHVFAGSLIVRGSGVAEVVATGLSSEIGKIGQSLRNVETQAPRLQMQMRQLVRLFAVLGIAVSLGLVVLHGLLRGNWLEGALAGIALGMSMLPEEFPVVLTVFMAMGAWRMSQARVLTRRAAAIEARGSATVLCTDKTGTLTENRMKVVQVWMPGGQTWDLDGGTAPARASALLKAGALASAPQGLDPMDRAFHELGGDAARHLTLVKSYGLRPDLLAVTQVWRSPSGHAKLKVVAKGAPESIARLCRMSKAEKAGIAAAVDGMAARGLRVLGVAAGKHNRAPLPHSPLGYSFTFIGLVGLADPLRSSVQDAVRTCRAAGIRVVMITGDYPATARAIAAQAGIADTPVLSGDEIAALDDEGLRQTVKSATVFARVMPQQKLRIVNALKSNGEIVAMTGDGVNDAPSLKAAHIGIAMGGRGTDVAREASAIVLLDDDFGSIVKAVTLGRRIYDNLRKAMGFILAVHVPIAGLALAPLLLGMPVLFSPIHIAFLEMVIDPVCSLAFEAEGEEGDTMARPPRDPREALFTWPMIGWSVLQGGLALAVVGGVYFYANSRGMPEDELRALSFFTLVLTVISLIFVDRTFSSSLVQVFTRGNRALTLVLTAVFGIMSLALLVPQVADLFRFGPLHWDDLLTSAAAAAGLLLLLETLKASWSAVRRRSGAAA